MGDQLIAVRKLHHPPEIHHADPVGNMLHRGKVMCNEQIGQPHLLLQIFKHIDDLCLDGHVQR